MTITYNLFRRASHPQLCCAVHQTDQLPIFVKGPAWRYGGIAEETDFLNAGIRQELPEWACKRYGFYLFHDHSYVDDAPAS
jgi:hypothetical protein